MLGERELGLEKTVPKTSLKCAVEVQNVTIDYKCEGYVLKTDVFANFSQNEWGSLKILP